MRTGLIIVALASAALSSGASAQGASVLVRSQPTQAVAKLATQGIGYSVVHQPVGVAARSYRIHLACTIAYRNATAHCPTTAHDAYCPDARIVCR